MPRPQPLPASAVELGQVTPRTASSTAAFRSTATRSGNLASGDEHKVAINDVQNDHRIHDREWARDLKLESFAGYQLRAQGGETLGVLALFAGHLISADEHAMIDGLSSTAAHVVQQAVAEEELQVSINRYHALFDSAVSPSCTSLISKVESSMPTTQP